MDKRKVLKIENNDKEIVIRFPMQTATIVILILTFIVATAIFIAVPIFSEYGKNNAGLWWGAYAIIIVLMAGNFALWFLRKLVINKEKRKIIYFSIFKQTFNIDEITDLEVLRGISLGDDSYSAPYFLIVKLCKKKIEIPSQTEEQCQMLKKEIEALFPPAREGFKGFTY